MSVTFRVKGAVGGPAALNWANGNAEAVLSNIGLEGFQGEIDAEALLQLIVHRRPSKMDSQERTGDGRFTTKGIDGRIRHLKRMAHYAKSVGTSIEWI